MNSLLAGKETAETRDTYVNETAAGDLSICQRKWGLDIPTYSLVMYHYACRLLGNEPPILKMKWAGKDQLPGFGMKWHL